MRRLQITRQAMRALKPALQGARSAITREIEQGISQLYKTDEGNLYVVIRREGNVAVYVAVAGTGLYRSRHELIDFARGNHFASIRFHTKYPERLRKGLAGLPLTHVAVRHALLGRDEYIYSMELH